MDSAKLDDALETIAGVQHSSQFFEAIGTIRDIYGLAHLAYCGMKMPTLTKAPPVIIVTYPKEWIDLYHSEDFFRIDPVFAAGRNAFLPTDWASLDQTSVAARHVFSEADRYGIGRQGMSLPMRGPHGDAAAFAFTVNGSPDRWSGFEKRYKGDLSIIGQHFHARVVSTYFDELGLQVPLSLTRRQQQCLQLRADGLSQKQIAEALGIAVQSVRLHHKRARAALGAPSLMRAVIAAIDANLIDVR